MKRHVNLVVPAPGRAEEGVQALQDWLKAVKGAPGFLGGTVLRDYAHEIHGLGELLILTHDMESREIAPAFREATKDIPNPLAKDNPNESLDQTWVLAGEHTHDASGGHVHPEGVSHFLDGLKYNAGGGLFALITHIHTDVIADSRP